MELKQGDQARPFEVSDKNGNTINLENYKGKKVLLSFYRYAERVFCNLRINQLSQLYPEWSKHNFEIIAFFQSPMKDVNRQFQGKDVPFSIIAHPEREVYASYGVTKSSSLGFIKGALRVDRMLKSVAKGNKIKIGYGDIKLKPADFLIDKNGVVQTAYYANDISDHISMESITAFIGI